MERQAIDKSNVSTLFFVASAYRMDQLHLVKWPSIYGSDALTFSPMIVDGLLAIEVYLKFLKCCELIEAGKPIEFLKTHNLGNLYLDLNDKDRKAIEESLESKHGCGSGLAAFLEGAANDFVEYRYLAETRSYEADMSFAVKLNDVLHDICRGIKNEKELQMSQSDYSATYDNKARAIANDAVFFIPCCINNE